MHTVYLHIPFCLSKCHYCDFYSLGWGRKTLPEQVYLAAVGREIDRWERWLAPSALEPIETLYFGGGTPSLLSPATLQALLQQVQRLAPLAPGAEVTLEVNPKTVDKAKLLEFAQAGANRISMGVQSLDDGLLDRLGRAHTGREALTTLDHIYGAGFERVSVDLD